MAETDNIEVVRSIYATGCWDIGVDATPALAYISEDFEFVNDPEAAMPGIRYGHEGFATAMQSADDVLEHFRHEPLAFTPRGDHVLVEIMLHARGRVSQAELSRPEWHVWTLRDGKAVRVQWFKDQAAKVAFERPIGPESRRGEHGRAVRRPGQELGANSPWIAATPSASVST